VSPRDDKFSTKDARIPGMRTAVVTRVTTRSSKGDPRSMKTAALSLLLVAFASAVVAQTPYIETFEVRLHNLDVVVSDAKGNAVRGLTKEDFIVTENSAPQAITNFAVYDASRGTATNINDTTPEAEEKPAVSAPPPRKIVFFIDELGLPRRTRNSLYENAKKFLDAMREGDIAAVVRPTAKEKIVQEFTGDRAALERALKTAIEESEVQAAGLKAEVAALRWALRNTEKFGVKSWSLNGDNEPPETSNQGMLVRHAKHAYADAATRRVEHRLGQLRALTTSLAGVEGKKIVVLLTMGLSAKPGSEAFDFAETYGSLAQAAPLGAGDDPSRLGTPVIRDFTPVISEIARSAAANGVTIYALEPDVPLDLNVRGNAGVPGKMAASGDIGPDPNMELSPSFLADLQSNGEVTLATLTETTGGKWFRGTGSIDDAFRQVSEDASFYYSLAYRATGDTDAARGVKVSIRNRPELRVRTRSEVLAKSTSREMSDLVVASLLYPRTVNELGIEVTAGTPQKDRGWYTIPLDVVIPLKNLTFFESEDDEEIYVATFDLHYAAAGEQRDFGSGGKRQQRIEITSEQHEQLGTTTYRYKTGIQVSPGRARIAIGVLDTATKLTGFRTVEVVTQ